MRFEITFIQLITICAIINGFVFSYLIFIKKENRRANRFLSLMIVSMSLTFTPYMLDDKVWHVYRWLAWMPFSLSYWIGPSFYFYVRTLTSSDRFKKKDLWHFSPIVLNFFHSVYHAIVLNSNPYPIFHHFAEILESAAILSILTYMWINFRSISAYQESLLSRVSNIDAFDLQWVKKFIIVITTCFLIVLGFLIFSIVFFGAESYYDWNLYKSITMLMYTLILYWLSINGYQQAQTFKLAELIDEDETKTTYSNVIEKLNGTLESDKMYRNPELSLSELSRSTGISERAISDALNKELEKNFFRYVNEFRVEEVKERLLDPKYDHLKILSLAQDAGFNSKASFNRVFKNHTGFTPKEFKSNSH